MFDSIKLYIDMTKSKSSASSTVVPSILWLRNCSQFLDDTSVAGAVGNIPSY